MDEPEITTEELEEYFSSLAVLEEADAALDDVESMMLSNPENLIEFPLKHVFTPYMYIREIFMPKGSFLTSRIHGTEHPFAVLEGMAIVYDADGGTVELSAGHSGITLEGTRRALFIEEDCRWVTYHVLSKEEEELRKSGMGGKELATIVENRILIRRELNDTGKTTFELYQESLGKDSIGKGA
jgi:hypothetical protein